MTMPMRAPVRALADRGVSCDIAWTRGAYGVPGVEMRAWGPDWGRIPHPTMPTPETSRVDLVALDAAGEPDPLAVGGPLWPATPAGLRLARLDAVYGERALCDPGAAVAGPFMRWTDDGTERR